MVKILWNADLSRVSTMISQCTCQINSRFSGLLELSTHSWQMSPKSPHICMGLYSSWKRHVNIASVLLAALLPSALHIQEKASSKTLQAKHSKAWRPKSENYGMLPVGIKYQNQSDPNKNSSRRGNVFLFETMYDLFRGQKLFETSYALMRRQLEQKRNSASNCESDDPEIKNCI